MIHQDNQSAARLTCRSAPAWATNSRAESPPSSSLVLTLFATSLSEVTPCGSPACCQWVWPTPLIGRKTASGSHQKLSNGHGGPVAQGPGPLTRRSPTALHPRRRSSGSSESMYQVTWNNNSDFFHIQLCKLGYFNMTCIAILGWI